MRKNILSGIIFFCLSCIFAGQTELCAQDLAFIDGCDFGTVQEKDGAVTKMFRFRNDRRDTLVICNITTTCRCITGTADFSKVAPGETGTVSLTFNPAYRSGEFSYPVVLWYADGMARQTIRVKGNVLPMMHPIEEDHPYNLGDGLYASHKVLLFGTMNPGETKRMFFRYGNGTSEPMTLDFEVDGCCADHIVMEKHLELAPDERGKLYVSLTMPQGYSGNHVNYIWLVVNGVRLETPISVKMTTRTADVSNENNN